MSTVDECRKALHAFAGRLAARAAESPAGLDFDRTLTCRVTDLSIAFRARLAGGRIVDLADGDDPDAKITLTATSDDLVDLMSGRLDVGAAWASGRVKINAGFLDLIKLRTLL